MTPLERAARALHDSQRTAIVEYAISRGISTQEAAEKARPCWDDLGDAARDPYRAAVRIVLTAIREPSAHMLGEVDQLEASPLWYPDEPGEQNSPSEIWQAMIDAALSEDA